MTSYKTSLQILDVLRVPESLVQEEKKKDNAATLWAAHL